MLRKLLRTIGLSEILDKKPDQRKSNREKWKSKRRRKKCHKKPQFDHDHCHGDWTY